MSFQQPSSHQGATASLSSLPAPYVGSQLSPLLAPSPIFPLATNQEHLTTFVRHLFADPPSSSSSLSTPLPPISSLLSCLPSVASSSSSPLLGQPLPSVASLGTAQQLQSPNLPSSPVLAVSPQVPNPASSLPPLAFSPVLAATAQHHSQLQQQYQQQQYQQQQFLPQQTLMPYPLGTSVSHPLPPTTSTPVVTPPAPSTPPPITTHTTTTHSASGSKAGVGPTQVYHTITFSAKPLKAPKSDLGSKKRKRWSPEDMEQAISLVEKNKMSARAAALVSNVPRSTLWDRLCQRSSYQGRSQKVKRRRQSLT